MSVGFSREPQEQLERLVQATRERVERAKAFYVHSVFSHDLGTKGPALDGQRDSFLFAAKGLETVGLDMLLRQASRPEVARRAWVDLLWPAFRLRRSVLCGDRSPNGLEQWADEAIDGLLSHRQPELRLALEGLDLSAAWAGNGQGMEWGTLLRAEVMRAFLLLVRKSHGFDDLQSSLAIIKGLRQLQTESEAPYLTPPQGDGGNGSLEMADRAAKLVALYNIARAVELTGEHLSGQFEKAGNHARLAPEGIKNDIDRLALNAREVLSGRDAELRLLAGRLGEACKALVDASVFSVVVPAQAHRFLLDLTSGDRPVLELWYAQREALRRSLLDPTKQAIVVSMPTSAGKTLLAELAMVQAYNDDPTGRIVYVAPTRSLVTQISLTLRRDLAGLDLRVRVATPSYELNPVEDQVLAGNFQILVTTPEKLDLLVRLDHPSVRRLTMVVVDEAHNLNDAERGARLELLLATLRRERAGMRFLLLTPFGRNAEELARWLGGEQGVPIIIDWKPNDRVVGAIVRGPGRQMKFVSLESAHSDCPGGEGIPLGVGGGGIKSSKALSREAALKWAQVKQGAVLLWARGRKSAESHAERLAERMGTREVPEAVDVVCRFLQSEVGGEHPLSAVLEKGVAFHHAGLSSEARYFVERLVEEGAVKILCATTTLAQGVHFPLSVAVVESLHRSVRKRGRWSPSRIQPWEFWNVAGRVGRTLVDPLGVVAFAAPESNEVDQFQEYLKHDAGGISSTLLEMVQSLRGQTNIVFNTALIGKVDALSPFIQYILHVLAVAGREAVRDLENVLRASFAYGQLREQGVELADELIRIARRYVDTLQASKGQAIDGFAKLADGTGFSSPSVDVMWREWRGSGAPRAEAADWTCDALFPPDGSPSPTAVRVIETLKQVPEIRLGTEDEGDFDSRRVARIVTAWVNGTTITDLAGKEYRDNLLQCAQHVYGTICNFVPWGLRAIQRVTFAGQPQEVWNELDLLPAMVYHGVRSKEAIALRMLNVPRFAAEGLAEQWRQERKDPSGDPSAWLDSRSDEHWNRVLGERTAVTGAECRVLWEIIEGRKSWGEVFHPAK